MDNISFSETGWQDYLYWQTQDRKTLKKINLLLQDILRNGNSGIGKPEPLKHREGYWSRHIDEKNRIVYTIKSETVFIIACRGHYDDK